MISTALLLIAIIVETITTIKNIKKEKVLNKLMNEVLEAQKEDIVICSNLVAKHNKTIDSANEVLDISEKLIEAIKNRS